jgi:hypothetical protein
LFESSSLINAGGQDLVHEVTGSALEPISKDCAD